MASKSIVRDCPLSTSDYADIQRALEKLNTHRINCEQAKMAGLDVEADIAMNEAMRDRFQAYKKTYFPNKV